MKALCLDAPRQLHVRDLPDPVPGPGEALVEIVLCGICGSDISAYKGSSPVIHYPMIGMGHEGTGIIREIGSNPQGLQAGDHVCLEPYIACGSCYTCALGRPNNCENLRTRGIHRDGLMATLVAHPVENLHRIPDGMSWEHAALVEPLSNAVHALRRAKLQAGERCLIFGAGPIGTLTAMTAAAYGSTPLVVDLLEDRLDFLRALGIAKVCNNGREDMESFIRDAGGGDLPEVVVDCTGSAEMAGACVQYARHGGRVVFVGLPPEDSRINVTGLIKRELDLFASRNSNDCFPEAVHLIQSRKVAAEKLLTAVVAMEEAAGLFEKMLASPQDYVKTAVGISPHGHA